MTLGEKIKEFETAVQNGENISNWEYFYNEEYFHLSIP